MGHNLWYPLINILFTQNNDKHAGYSLRFPNLS